jgi:hypothetical protein
MLSALYVDGPRAPGGRSAGRLSASNSLCSSVSLCAFHTIHFTGVFLLHGVRGRSVLECRTVRDGADGPRAYHGRSVIEGAVLEVRGLFSDGPSQPRGQSA